MSKQRKSAAGPTAVLINRDPHLLKELAGLVRLAGVEPTTFTGVEQALAALDPQAPPVLIVTDIHMTGIDGWQCCRLLRSPGYAPFNRVPILIVSAGFAGAEPDLLAADLGAEEFLAAPVDAEAFVEKVRRLRDGAKQPPRPQRVLIVEDDPSMVALLQHAFTAHGYHVDQALSAREGLALFEQAAYGVAVIDYHLPDKNGDTLLDRFKSLRPDCACIMITGDQAPKLALDWMKLGAAAYITKPFDTGYLIELCTRARRERALLRTGDLLEKRTRTLHDRDRLLQATAESASILLAGKQLKEAVPEALARIGRASTHDRIYVFECHSDPATGEPLFSQRYEWVREGIAPQIGEPGLQNIAPDRLPYWFERLFQGLPVGGRVADLPETERNYFGRLDILALFAVPITVDGRFWGFVGVDDCTIGHEWEAGENALLKTVALAVGTAIARRRMHIKLETALALEQRQKEELLRLTTAIEQSPNTVVVTDREGVIQYANPAFEQTTGYRREEVVGRKDMRLQVGGAREKSVHEEIWKTITSGTVWSGQVVSHRKNGETFREEACIAPVRDEAGATCSYVAIGRDITEELARDEMLSQAQKMDSIGRLAGGIAHDFNNMLGVILGNTELALEQVEPDSLLAGDLEEIRKAAHRSAELTRKLLTFARKQAAKPEVLELNQTVEEMLKMLRRLIDEAVEIDWQPDETPGPVCIDPSQLDQILVNLCVNAREAITDRGRITLGVRTTRIEARDCARYELAEPGEYVVLSVSDTGTGMDEVTRMHMFEPFFTTKKTKTNAGLGLPAVYGIVRQNNGFIQVDSTPGQGSTFRIHFPRHAVMPEDLSTQSMVAPTASGEETVLLVEDEAGILNMVRRILEQQGYTVLATDRPHEALELARRHEGDLHLLLTDVVMPGMNGHELAEQIQQFRPETRCLFMSGYSDEVISRSGIISDSVHLIQKPFTRNDLAERIRQVIGR